MGATLSQGLEWILKGNSKGLTTEIDKGKKAVKELGKETEKVSDGMGKGFLKTKESITKVRGAVLFYGAAIAALVTPALQAMDAQKKLAVAATLVGQKMGGPMLAQIKSAANVMNTTFTDAAGKAATVMTKFGTDSTNAIAAVEQGWKTAKLGIATDSESIQASAEVAKAAFLPLGQVAQELGPKMNAAATLTQTALGTISGALAGVAPLAQQANVSLDDVLTALVGLDKMGIPVQQSQAMIATALKAAIEPSEDQRAALEALGLFGYNSLASIGGQNFLPFMATATQAVGTQKGSVTELLGNVTGLNAQYTSDAPNVFSKATADIATNVENQNKAIWTQLSDLERISLAWTKIQNILAAGIAPILEKIAWAMSGGIGESIADFFVPPPEGYATGGWVGGKGSGDTVPAMLEPGEFVVNKHSAKMAKGWLSDLNNRKVRGYAFGGTASSFGGSAFSYSPYAQWMMKMFGHLPGSIGLASASFGQSGLSKLKGLAQLQAAAMNAAKVATGSGPQPTATASSLYKGGAYSMSGWSPFGQGYSPWAFSKGGAVPAFPNPKRMAAGGSVTKTATSAIPQGKPIGNSPSLHVDTLNVNLKGATFTPTFVRDYVVPPLLREMESGRNRRARTGR